MGTYHSVDIVSTSSVSELSSSVYIIIYIYIYIYIYTIVNWKIKVPTGGIYTIYYPVAVINDIH